jgi:hypothetical protein
MLPNHPAGDRRAVRDAGVAATGRIDLGSAAPVPTSHRRALRTSRLSDGDTSQQLAELVALEGSFPEDHPYSKVRAVSRPSGPTSGCSARAATAPSWQACSGCRLPSPTTSAQGHGLRRALPAVVPPVGDPRRALRHDRRPVVCADTVEHARWLPLPGPHHAADAHRSAWPQATSQEAAEYNHTPAEKELLRSITGSHVVGSPETVRDELVELADRMGAGADGHHQRRRRRRAPALP